MLVVLVLVGQAVVRGGGVVTGLVVRFRALLLLSLRQSRSLPHWSQKKQAPVVRQHRLVETVEIRVLQDTRGNLRSKHAERRRSRMARAGGGEHVLHRAWLAIGERLHRASTGHSPIPMMSLRAGTETIACRAISSPPKICLPSDGPDYNRTLCACRFLYAKNIDRAVSQVFRY